MRRQVETILKALLAASLAAAVVGGIVFVPRWL